MKTKLLTILVGLSLVALISGAFLLTSGQAPFPATIKFDPRFIDWDTTYPQYWAAEIRAPTGSGWNVKNIDPDTIRFEGFLPIISGSMYYYKGAQNVQFDGYGVWSMLIYKVGHMGIPPGASTKTPVHYDFTVSGNLYNGSAWAGTGWIAVRFVNGFPPPPP